MIYPKKLSSKKSDMILKICMLASVLIAILLVVINRLTTPGIPWAALTNAGILYIWITVMYAINKNILTIVHDCCEYEGGINNAGRCQFYIFGPN